MQLVKNETSYQIFHENTLLMSFEAVEEVCKLHMFDAITHVSQLEFVAEVLQKLNVPLDKNTQNNLGLMKLEPEAAYILSNYYDAKLLEIAGAMYWLVITKATKKQDYKEYSSQLLCLMSIKFYQDFESIELLVKNSQGADKHLVMAWVMGAGNLKGIGYFLTKYKFTEEEWYQFLEISMKKDALAVFEALINRAPASDLMGQLMLSMPAQGSYADLIRLKVTRLN